MITSKHRMARVEIRPSGGHEYAVVVEDVQDEHGNWRKKTIRSFGNAQNQENVEKARKFAHAINAGKSLLEAEWDANQEDLKELLGVAVGLTIAGMAAKWLFEDEV